MTFSCASPLEIGQLAHEDVRIPVAARGAPIVEMECELAVAAYHQVRFQPHAREAVVAAGAAVIAQWRLRNGIGALRRMVLDRNASRNARAYGRASHDHAVVVVDLDPVVVLDPDF